MSASMILIGLVVAAAVVVPVVLNKLKDRDFADIADGGKLIDLDAA